MARSTSCNSPGGRSFHAIGAAGVRSRGRCAGPHDAAHPPRAAHPRPPDRDRALSAIDRNWVRTMTAGPALRAGLRRSVPCSVANSSISPRRRARDPQRAEAVAQRCEEVTAQVTMGEVERANAPDSSHNPNLVPGSRRFGQCYPADQLSHQVLEWFVRQPPRKSGQPPSVLLSVGPGMVVLVSRLRRSCVLRDPVGWLQPAG